MANSSLKRKLTPVPFTAVKLTDSFWAPRIETNRTNTLPREYELCETTGPHRRVRYEVEEGPAQPAPHFLG